MLEGPPWSPPVGVPASVRMLYSAEGNAKGMTWHAKSELVWQQEGDRYDARMEVSAFLVGSRVQTSTGKIDATGLVPERFSDKARRSEQAAHFERDKGSVVFSSNAPEAPLYAGAQDRLGVFMQLGALLAGDPTRYPEGSSIALQTVGTRDAEDWTFTIAAREPLDLPAGKVDAVRLERAPRKEFDTRVEVWYGPSLGYLPVRIRITQQSGDYVDQKLDSLGKP